MRAGLRVYGDDIRSQSGVFFHVASRFFHHHVHIKHRVRQRPQRPDHRRTERNLRNIHPVHHVNVYILCPGLHSGNHISSEIREIR